MSGNTLVNDSLKAFSEEGQVQPEEQDLPGAYQRLQDEVEQLKAMIVSLEAKVSALQATQDTQAENQLIQLRLINDLRHKEPGKTELSRAEKIEKYLAARPDHKATFETLKGHLGIGNDQLNKTIKLLLKNPGKHTYTITKTTGDDKRKRSLIMLSI